MQNKFIECDNIDGLNWMLNNGIKVKMIYADPPYNTNASKDYKDSMPKSNWVNFMEERLVLCRKLLTEDGSIYISIDDNMQHYLRLLMDRVFGEKNFVAQLVWRRNRGQNNTGKISIVKEYVIVYGKNKKLVQINKVPLSESGKELYKDKHRRDIQIGGHKDACRIHSSSFVGIFSEGCMKKRNHEVKEFTITDNNGKQHTIKTDYSEKIIRKLEADGLIHISQNGSICRLKKNENLTKITTDWLCPSETPSNAQGRNELKSLFGIKFVFDNPKPVGLITHLIKLAINPDDTILDLFAGSGTTAHAVAKLNKEDGGNRKWILLQNDDPCNKFASQLGYATISEICLARIEKAYNHLECDLDFEHKIML